MASNGKMSFAIAISLLTDKFNSGSKRIQGELKNLQYKFIAFSAALGASGIGVGGFINSLKNAAQESAKANNTLKNVVKSNDEFRRSQEFLINTSNKYKLNINDLTANFAKFKATANNANMSLGDQEKIFDAVSRASKSFNLSADETNGVFLAISQMMSKNKVSSEELRQQLAERLPIAMQAMAKGLGVTNAELEVMMKKGQVLATDALPKFADALNSMSKGADTETIEGFLNVIQNKITELSNNLAVADIYKGLLKGITNAFDYVVTNTKTVVAIVKNLIISVVIGQGINKLIQSYIRLEAQALASYKKQLKASKESFNQQAWEANKFSNVATFAFAKIGLAIKSMFKAFAPMLIISGITAIIQKIKEHYDEQKRLNNLLKDYRNAEKTAGDTNEEIVKMKALQAIMNNKFESQKNIKNAQSELLKMLDLEKGTQAQINKKLEQRIDLIKASARAELYSQTIAQNENKIDNLARSKGLTTKQLQELTTIYVKNKGKDDIEIFTKLVNKLNEWGVSKKSSLAGGYYNSDDYLPAVKEVGGLNFINQDAKSKLESLLNFLDKNNKDDDKTNNNTNNNTSSGKNKVKTLSESVKEEEDSYKKSLSELTNQLNSGVKNQQEYDDELNKLKITTHEKIGALLGKDATSNETFNSTLVDKNQLKIDEEYKKYTDDIANLDKQLKTKQITEEEYTNQLEDLIDNTLNNLNSFEGIDVANNDYIKILNDKKEELKNKKVYKVEKTDEYDNTFDYKKSNGEIMSAKLDTEKNKLQALIKGLGDDDIEEKIKNAGGNLDELKKNYNKQAKDLIDQINLEMGNVTTLEEAIKLNELKTDINDLSKELNNGLYEGFKNIVGTSKSIADAWGNVSETMSNLDSSIFEKIFSLFDAITTTVDGVISVMETIKTLTDLTIQLGLAKKRQAQEDTQATTQMVTNAAISATASIAGAGATVSANAIEDTSNAKTALTGAVKSGSKTGLPFPFNLLAIAASVAGVIAVISSLPKFADGGVVGGNSYFGDKILARVNSAELMLNQSQQGTLYGLLNKNNGGGVSGQVEFKIEGKALKGVLTNYDKIKSKAN